MSLCKHLLVMDHEGNYWSYWKYGCWLLALYMNYPSFTKDLIQTQNALVLADVWPAVFGLCFAVLI